MKVIDATRDRTRPLIRRWKGRLKGCVDRTLASANPAETWAAQLPLLKADANRAVRAMMVRDLRRAGWDPDAEWLADRFAARAVAEAVVARDISAERVAYLLIVAGLDDDRILRLSTTVELEQVAAAVAHLEVIDALLPSDDVRGLA